MAKGIRLLQLVTADQAREDAGRGGQEHRAGDALDGRDDRDHRYRGFPVTSRMPSTAVVINWAVSDHSMR